ncbi:MAG: FixG Ig-like domain-containing protein, partial [Henriciella sp.]
NRGTFEINVLKDRSPPYVRLSNGDIRNGYTLKLVNKAGEARELSVETLGIEGLSIEVVGLEAEDGKLLLPVAANGVDRYRFLVTLPSADIDGRRYFTLVLTDAASGEVHTNRTSFMTPGD